MKYKLYSALGLNKNSNPTQDEIKRAYKKMAMEYHPDKNKDNPSAEEKFKEVSNAYAVLSDDSKKRVYDQVGDDGYNEGDNADHFSSRMNHADIFEHFFGGNNPFANHFGFDIREQMFNNQQNCQSVHKQISISLDEAYEGISKLMTISITKNCLSCIKQCNNCNGTGQIKQVRHMGILTQIFTGRCDKCNGQGQIINAKKSCTECEGNGQYTKEMQAHLTLPKGVHTGYKTVFPEMGEQPSKPNQKAGDLILEVIVAEHPVLKRNGNDLYYKCDLTFIESITGKEIAIPYFKDTVKLNTNMFGVVYPTKQYMIEKKGMPIIETNNFGNMFIEFNINYPKIKNKTNVEELERLLRDTFQL
jgi:DnaJ family protein A protein 2